MTIYSYKALGADGRSASGAVEAASRREAAEILRSRGVHVTSMSVSRGYARRAAGASVSARRARQTCLFTSFMRRLLRAGMPVVEALEAAGAELDGYPIGEVIRRTAQRVAGGSSLADALSHEKAYFDDLNVAMIRAAETSGTLPAAFDTIHGYQTRRRELRRRIFSALAYPIVLVGVSILAVAFLLGFVVPRIEETLQASRVPLPLVTRIVIAGGDFTKVYWPLLTAAAVVIVFAPRTMRGFAAGRRFFDRFVVEAPLVRRFVRSAVVGRFSRTLSALLKSGLRVADALEIAGRVSNNLVFETAVADARRKIVSGSDLAGALGESGLFPGYAIQIVAIGERTGTLPESFDDVALSEEEALETTAERALTLLEPAVILVMAVVVGLIVASVLLPILSLSNIS